MSQGTKTELAKVAYNSAMKPFHGYVNGEESNIGPIIRHFPKWNIKAADCCWCAAFVYYCLVEAGFDIPYSPDECVTCSLAGCGGFEEYAMGDDRVEYIKPDGNFFPSAGDIVIFDRVFENKEHDHIGIVVGHLRDNIVVAEGNVPGTNTSGIVLRKNDEHIRCFIRIPDGYTYSR